MFPYSMSFSLLSSESNEEIDECVGEISFIMTLNVLTVVIKNELLQRI